MSDDDRSICPGTPTAESSARELLGLLGWSMVSLAVAVFHNHLWMTPNLPSFTLIASEFGRRPEFPTTPAPDYLLTNVALPALASVTGLVAPHRYVLLHMVVALLGFAACAVLCHRRFGYTVARTLVVICAAAPGVSVIMGWLGQPDALFMPLAMATALVRRRAVLAVVVVAAGLTHPEQALAMGGVAVAARFAIVCAEGRVGGRARARETAIDAAVVAASLVASTLLVRAYLWIGDIEILNPRSQYLKMSAAQFWRHHTQNPLQLVYLILGPLWLLVPAVGMNRLLRSRRTAEHVVVAPLVSRSPDPESIRSEDSGGSRLAAGGQESPESGDSGGSRGSEARESCPTSTAWVATIVAAAVALVPVALTLDETRVYAMITAPLLVVVAVLMVAEWAESSARTFTVLTAVMLVVVMIIPGGFTAGIASWSYQLPLGEFLRFVQDGRHPGDLGRWILGPFHYVIPT